MWIKLIVVNIGEAKNIVWKEEYRYNPRELTKYIRRANSERMRRWRAPL